MEKREYGGSRSGSVVDRVRLAVRTLVYVVSRRPSVLLLAVLAVVVCVCSEADAFAAVGLFPLP